MYKRQTLSNLTASIISQSRNLPPWQVAALKESTSAMLSAVGGESKNKPVDLATSPPSSDQDKSSWKDTSIDKTKSNNGHRERNHSDTPTGVLSEFERHENIC